MTTRRCAIPPVVHGVKYYANSHTISCNEERGELLKRALITATVLDGNDPIRRPTDD